MIQRQSGSGCSRSWTGIRRESRVLREWHPGDRAALRINPTRRNWDDPARWNRRDPCVAETRIPSEIAFSCARYRSGFGLRNTGRKGLAETYRFLLESYSRLLGASSRYAGQVFRRLWLRHTEAVHQIAAVHPSVPEQPEFYELKPLLRCPPEPFWRIAQDSPPFRLTSQCWMGIITYMGL